MSGRKIPGNCRVCGDRLDETTMREWIKHCESLKRDPVVEAHRNDPTGILCVSCRIRNLMDEADEGNPAAKRLLSMARRNHLGIKAVQTTRGGKR